MAPVKISVLKYIMKRVATNTNSKDIFCFFYEQRQRELKKTFRELKWPASLEKWPACSQKIGKISIQARIL